MPHPQALADATLEFLGRAYPGARYELDWETPLELLVATILAAQCTDARVNQVTRTLFRRYRTARDYARADPAELEQIIRPTGTYKAKARSIQAACQTLLSRFGGQVPRTMEELTSLPGVARKTANVVLNAAFDIPSGVIVDTHVARVSHRLGLTRQTKPELIERDLMNLVPQDRWTFFGPAMVLHGRYTCTARNPNCPACGLNGVCEKNGVDPDSIGKGQTYGAEAEEVAACEDEPAAGPSREMGYDDEEDTPARRPPPRQQKSHSYDSAEEPAVHDTSQNDNGESIYNLSAGWKEVLADELDKPYFRQLAEFVSAERAQHEVFPPPQDVYNALAHTPYENVNVLLLGQDPYHDIGQAHGLCFSVRPGVRPPPSLVNMFKELRDDLGIPAPRGGCLTKWADQGVLLLNAVLTVRAHQPNSHKDKGWEKFTDAVIRKVSEKPDPVVFVLWGGYAQKKEKLIDAARHTVIKSAHPSPLSASNGFFGSRPFSRINAALRSAGKPEIDWSPA